MTDQLDIFAAPTATPSLGAGEGHPLQAGGLGASAGSPLAVTHGDALTPEERLISRLLSEHKGRESAISVKRIGDLFNMTDVSVRQTVRHLIDYHGMCIGSSVGNPSGYFLAVTPEDVATVTKSLRHRGISILARAAKLQKTSVEAVFGQAAMELEEAK